MLLLWVVLPFISAQFDLSDNDIQRVLKAEGFYLGDVNAGWNDGSLKALAAFGAKSNLRVNQFKPGVQKDRFLQNKLGNWLKANSPVDIKPRSVGVFFVTFNKDTCTGPESHCRTREISVQAVLGDLYQRPKINAQYYFALGTRGLHRFNFSDDWVHHVRLPASAVSASLTGWDGNTILDLVKKELGWDPATRYDRRAYKLPAEYTRMKETGLAVDKDVFFKILQSVTFMHEIGHTLGLNHVSGVASGRTSVMGGQLSFNAVELDWLRVISDNILLLTSSSPRVQIKSLTSVSEGYREGDHFSPISGNVAALYSSLDGPEYYIEWHEKVRQDLEWDPPFNQPSLSLVNVLLVHHRLDTGRKLEADAVIPIGGSWTSPRGDLTLIHTGPTPGIFEVRIGPVTNPSAPVKFALLQDDTKEFNSINGF